MGLADKRNQFAGITESALHRGKLSLAFRRIAPQRQHVFHAGRRQPVQHAAYVFLCRAYAREVRHRLDPVSRLIRETISIVFSRVDPPAPHVTETNAGSSGCSSAMVRSSCSTLSSDFGGKNSNEIDGAPDERKSRMNMTSIVTVLRSPNAAGVG